MYRAEAIINTTEEYIEIVPIGDVHYGNPNCSKKKFLDTVNRIEQSPKTYVILMGDLIDAIIPTDKRFDPDEDNKYTFIEDAYQWMKNALEPIKSRIICALTGNHEYKLHSLGFADLTKRLAEELGCKYAGYSAFINIKILPKTHQRSLMIYAHHGYIAGRKTGGTVNAIENISQYYDADIFMLAHSHKLFHTTQSRINWSGDRDVLFCSTGTFLETATWNKSSYSERAGFPPQRIGCLSIKYYPMTHKYTVCE